VSGFKPKKAMNRLPTRARSASASIQERSNSCYVSSRRALMIVTVTRHTSTGSNHCPTKARQCAHCQPRRGPQEVPPSATAAQIWAPKSP